MVTRPNPLKKDSRMDKITRKTSFGQWFSPINLQLFEEQVKTLKLDFYTKKLTTESFLKLLLYAQLQEVGSLHALSDCLFDDKLQKAVDLDSISISQLSRRLNGLNPDLFQRLFLDLVTQIHTKTHYTKLVMPLKIIDSSTLPLNLTNHRWAKFRSTKAGVKLHLRLVFSRSDRLFYCSLCIEEVKKARSSLSANDIYFSLRVITASSHLNSSS